MEIRDAIKIKEKLSEVLETVDEFGRQAEQFSKAKKGLNDLIDVLLNSNNLIGDLITESQKYLDDAKSIIDGECFAKICEQNNLAKQIAEDLKANSETSNSQLKETADDFIAHAQSLEEKCKELQSHINSVTEIKNEIESIVVENSTKVSSNIESTKKKIDELVEESHKSQDLIIDNHKKVAPFLEEQSKKLQQLIQAIDEKEAKTQNVIIENGEKISPLLTEYNEKLTSLKQFISDENNKVSTDLTGKINELWENQQEIIKFTDSIEKQNQSIRSRIEMFVEEMDKKVKKLYMFAGIAVAVVVVLQIITLLLK